MRLASHLLAVALLASHGAAAEPDQVARWRDAKLNPKWSIASDKAVTLFTRTRDVYDRLEKARGNGVPAQFIFGFHMRESDNSFRCHLHEGSPLTHRTRDVPKNRPPVWAPPFDWFTSALDALYDYEHLERRDWQHAQPALQAAESYNGLGYQRRGVPSPYLWSGTTIYQGGKYVRDGVWSATALDQQLGVCAVLLRMRERGMEIPAALRPPAPKPTPAPPAPEPPQTHGAGLIVPEGHRAGGWLWNFFRGLLP
jgi:lysozyme family protein